MVRIHTGNEDYFPYISYLCTTVLLLLARVVLSKYNDSSWDKLLITIAGLDFDLNIDHTMWYIL